MHTKPSAGTIRLTSGGTMNERPGDPCGGEPHAHGVSFYDRDEHAVALVADYVVDGLARGERVLLVVTEPHVAALDLALRSVGVEPQRARAAGRYVTLDAATTLATFMVDDLPDRDRFMFHVGGVIEAARADGSTVRAFGEMVALLWDEGNVAAALELESLWNRLADLQDFALLCAYPAAALGGAPLADVGRVCDLHSSVLPPSSYRGALPRTDAELDEFGRWSEVFVPVPEAVPAARRSVAAILEGWSAEDVAWDAALVTSELATNAVRHGQSAFRLLVSRAPGVVRVAVEDVADGWPRRRDAAVDAFDGRGLAIVEALSDRSGCEERLGGKVTWAEFTSTS